MRLKPKYFDLVELGGASAAGMVWRAAAAIEAGMCENVLCILGDVWDSKTMGVQKTLGKRRSSLSGGSGSTSVTSRKRYSSRLSKRAGLLERDWM